MAAETITVERSYIEEILARVERIEARLVAVAREADGSSREHELDDEARERWRAHLREQDDAGIIVDLLVLQKIAEGRASGPAAFASQVVTTTICEVLDRFVPVTLGEALDRYQAEGDAGGWASIGPNGH
jgi:hypothetical protein